MAARKKSPPSTPAEAGGGQKPARKPIPLGTDPAITLFSTEGKCVALIYWDLWFALVAVQGCDGDFDRLWERLGEKKVSSGIDRQAVERKRSHVRDLQDRLASSGLTAHDVLDAAGGLLRSEVRRARSRVLEHSERQYERSEAMHDTPRHRRSAHALRGYSGRFPVSPQPLAAEILGKFDDKGYYSHRDSFGLATKLDHYVDRAKAASMASLGTNRAAWAASAAQAVSQYRQSVIGLPR